MRGRLRDLLLGARLVFAGGRDGLLRTTFIAVGIGLGVAVMLGAAAIGPMIEARAERTDGRSYEMFRYPELEPAANTLLISDRGTLYRDIAVQGWLLQPEGDDAPVPPGLDALPQPGEMVVSPKLAELLAQEELLRERLDHKIVGTIADEGLSGPNEYSFYLGATSLDVAGMRPDLTVLATVAMLLGLVLGAAALIAPIKPSMRSAIRWNACASGYTWERAPMSLAPIERIRSTSATQRRIENMQKLINELSTHEMLADEIAWFLKFSPSGARKYIRDLREAGVIELHEALLVAAEGKLSKRLGSYGAEHLRAEGVEPMALLTVLARIGTSQPVEPIASLDELAATFDFATFGRAPAHFDPHEVELLQCPPQQPTRTLSRSAVGLVVR